MSVYATALKSGLLRDGIVVAQDLAGVIIGRGQPSLAIALLLPLEPAARVVCFADTLGGYYLQLATASMYLGALTDAETYLERLQQNAVGPWIGALATLIQARIAFAKGMYESSLAKSRTAKEGFLCQRKDLQVGRALSVEGETLARLGKRMDAIKTLEAAIDLLKIPGYSPALCAAYNTIAALTGAAKYKVAARKAMLSWRNRQL